MGDRIGAGPGAIVVTGVILNSALNAVERDRGKAAAELLKRLSEVVEESGSEEAKELFVSLSQELQKPKPGKSVLHSLWDGLEKALPGVVKIAEAAGGIAKLFG